ncbi:hypothetical protein GCM10025857_08570 [Alicyclobacillus contaminans]|uniref:hypothetical protein n=1 Tax=Alicyclobacillus contaminans TaxID=392016 RepID=UPI00041D8DBD|nr:hypothetical protein [Alicyclobacillus contaminans]GMA49500.1 hypothetical protein GCM10025857_08570 [Alicyclobacillus contaminans]
MGKRSVGKTGFVEGRWKPLLERAESSRLRRARALVKQGAVRMVTVAEGWVSGRVRSTQSHQELVQVRTVDWWVPYTDKLALWLARRPDWLAALYARVWNLEFVAFVEQAGLTLFPQPSMVDDWLAEARCSCSDPNALCPHVLALVWYMIGEMQNSPWIALRYVGVDMEPLMSVVKMHSTVPELPSQSEVRSGDEWMMAETEEEKVSFQSSDSAADYGLRQRIAPAVDAATFAEWRRRYITWD